MGSNPSLALCHAGIRIVVETSAPCDAMDVTIDVPTKCVPLSTERCIGMILDADDEHGTSLPAIPERVHTGVAADCTELATGSATGMQLVGVAHFLDSDRGDLQVEITIVTR